MEERAGGFVAYPAGLRRAVVGQGDTYGEARADIVVAARFRLATSGPDAADAEAGPGAAQTPRRPGKRIYPGVCWLLRQERDSDATPLRYA